MRYINLLVLQFAASVMSYDPAEYRLYKRSDNRPAARLSDSNPLAQRSTMKRSPPRNFRRGICLSKCTERSRPKQSRQMSNPPSSAAYQKQAQQPSSKRALERENNRSDPAHSAPAAPISLPSRHSGVSATGGSSQRSESPQVVPDVPSGPHSELPIVHITSHQSYRDHLGIGL